MTREISSLSFFLSKFGELKTFFVVFVVHLSNQFIWMTLLLFITFFLLYSHPMKKIVYLRLNNDEWWWWKENEKWKKEGLDDTKVDTSSLSVITRRTSLSLYNKKKDDDFYELHNLYGKGISSFFSITIQTWETQADSSWVKILHAAQTFFRSFRDSTHDTICVWKKLVN